ncbi:hypothetical protein MRX96_008609 [Rhipicephalus microplus]
MQGDDIVISGFSAYFPQADHMVEFKEKLYAGVEMVTEDDLRWPPGYNDMPRVHGKIKDLSRFDAQFFSTHPKQAHVMDPQLRLLLETSYEAILDAGYDPDTLRRRKIGVFIGNSASETGEAFKLDPHKDGWLRRTGITQGYVFQSNFLLPRPARTEYDYRHCLLVNHGSPK